MEFPFRISCAIKNGHLDSVRLAHCEHTYAAFPLLKFTNISKWCFWLTARLLQLEELTPLNALRDTSKVLSLKQHVIFEGSWLWVRFCDAEVWKLFERDFG